VSLYDYFDSRLQEANVQKNKEIIEEIRTRLTELRDAWNESLNQLNEAPALAATPAPAPVPTAAPAPVAQPLPVAAPAPSSGEYSGLSLMG
ncbi:MAG: flagellar protein FliS, partial [Verrucomicrobiota bacterium]|nr:flagellar protein FliS [Verrucomicrobiota bacterium]